MLVQRNRKLTVKWPPGFPCRLVFKNGTDGSLATAINAMRAAAQPHRFVGINRAGQVALLQTQGNPDGHVILRGGKAPNYSPADVAQCEKEMEQAGLRAVSDGRLQPR